MERSWPTRNDDFVYLKRQLPPEAGREGDAPGAGGHPPAARVPPLLPAGEVAPTCWNFTGVTRTAGKASSWRSRTTLAGHAGSRRVIRDRRGNVIGTSPRCRATAATSRCRWTARSSTWPIANSKAAVESEPRQGGRHRGAGRAYRRGAGAGQPAGVQPQQPPTSPARQLQPVITDTFELARP